MKTPIVFHEDVFYEYFRPLRHPSANFEIWGGHGLETFGADFQIVQNHPANFVWTVLDGCEGPDQWIAPGIHFVNRVCYLLTENPHDWAPVEFRIKSHPSSLTSLGLARRIGTLKRLLTEGSTHTSPNIDQPKLAR